MSDIRPGSVVGLDEFFYRFRGANGIQVIKSDEPDKVLTIAQATYSRSRGVINVYRDRGRFYDDYPIWKKDCAPDTTFTIVSLKRDRSSHALRDELVIPRKIARRLAQSDPELARYLDLYYPHFQR